MEEEKLTSSTFLSLASPLHPTVLLRDLVVNMIIFRLISQPKNGPNFLDLMDNVCVLGGSAKNVSEMFWIQ